MRMNYIGQNNFFIRSYSQQIQSKNSNQSLRRNRRVTLLHMRQRFVSFLAVTAVMLSVAVKTHAATGAQAVAVPASAAFGNVALGTTNTQTVAIQNHGAAQFTITKVTISGSGFHFSNLVTPHIVHLGKQHSFSVEFSPTAAGATSGRIVIETTAADPTLTIALNGTGTASTRTLSLSPTSLTFGNDATGTHQTLTTTLKNTGNSNVTISAISESDPQLGSSGGVSGATLAAGQTATLNVIYSPTKAGSFSGQLKVNSNASNSPAAISVTGSAFVPSTNPTVALSWGASTSANIAGYFVYRSANPASGFVKMNSAQISGLSYTDNAVTRGSTYYYAVSAINTAGAESMRCPEQSVSVP
jgi:hypothetical protein